MSQNEQLAILTPPMNKEARAYLRRKGCIVTLSEDGMQDKIVFPLGSYRGDEMWPRVTFALYVIYFPDKSFVIEHQGFEYNGVGSLLSLPQE